MIEGISWHPFYWYTRQHCKQLGQVQSMHDNYESRFQNKIQTHIYGKGCFFCFFLTPLPIPFPPLLFQKSLHFTDIAYKYFVGQMQEECKRSALAFDFNWWKYKWMRFKVDLKLYTVILLFHQSPTSHSDYTVTGPRGLDIDSVVIFANCRQHGDWAAKSCQWQCSHRAAGS